MTRRVEEWLESPAATRLLGWLTLILVATVAGLAALTVPDIRSDTSASRRTDDLASCRAQYRTAFDDATVVVFDTYGAVQDAIGSASVAAIRQDPTTLALIAAEIEGSIQDRQAAISDLLEASDIYNEAVDLSQSDPDAFLSQCEAAP